DQAISSDGGHAAHLGDATAVHPSPPPRRSVGKRSRRAQDAVLSGGVSPLGPGIAPGRSTIGGTGGLSPPHLGIAPVETYHDRCIDDQRLYSLFCRVKPVEAA